MLERVGAVVPLAGAFFRGGMDWWSEKLRLLLLQGDVQSGVVIYVNLLTPCGPEAVLFWDASGLGFQIYTNRRRIISDSNDSERTSVVLDPRWKKVTVMM